MTISSLAPSLHLLVAQAAAAPRSLDSWQPKDSIRIVTFIGLLIVFLVIGGIVLKYLRRRMLERESALDAPGSLMEELRRLKKTGVLTEAEYEATRRAATVGLRDKIAAGAAASTPRPAPRAQPIRPLSPPPRRPSQAARPSTGDRTARPGFDLTGAPLPTPKDD